MPRLPKKQTHQKTATKPEESTCYAHSANDEGRRHRLDDHLRAVAETAGKFCETY